MIIATRSRFVRNTPDKIRVLQDLIKNKDLDTALVNLENANKASAKSLILIIKQAKNEIKTKDKNVDKFKIIELRVDEGPKLKRRRFLHQGRATMILKRMAHITIVLSDNEKMKGAPNGSKS
jgi:large subunit ribosomal protein L22